MPDVSNLKRIAAILDVSVDYLLDEEVPMYLNVTKKPIDLEAFRDGRKLTRRRFWEPSRCSAWLRSANW